MRKSNLSSAFIGATGKPKEEFVPVPDTSANVKLAYNGTDSEYGNESDQLSDTVLLLLAELKQYDKDNDLLTGAGRRSKFNSQLILDIVMGIFYGATYKDACEAAGLAYNTFHDWFKWGELDPNDPNYTEKYKLFHDVIVAVNAQCAVEFTKIIHVASRKDPAFAIQWLKRRRRDEWGDNADITTGNEPIEFVVSYDQPKTLPLLSSIESTTVGSGTPNVSEDDLPKDPGE
jgi:hypothetical protein